MTIEQERNFDDWSDKDLADEMDMVDGLIEDYQNRLAGTRRTLNRFMEQREDLLDAIKQRSQKKGWTK